MSKIVLTLSFITAILFQSCSNKESKQVEKQIEKTEQEDIVRRGQLSDIGMVGEIYLQPYSDMKKEDVEYIRNHLVSELENYRIKVLPAIDIPRKNKSVHRDRFRADSIIRDMRRIANHQNADAVLAITSKDISTTYKGNVDWGVMGLGFRPGKGAVISTFRLNKGNKREQMLKLAMHELGHNLGLEHCPNQHCIMRDAKGKNNLNTTKHFCEKCKHIIELDVEKKWVNMHQRTSNK